MFANQRSVTVARDKKDEQVRVYEGTGPTHPLLRRRNVPGTDRNDAAVRVAYADDLVRPGSALIAQRTHKGILLIPRSGEANRDLPGVRRVLELDFLEAQVHHALVPEKSHDMGFRFADSFLHIHVVSPFLQPNRSGPSTPRVARSL